jgi:lipoprotein-releasing system permease protein
MHVPFSLFLALKYMRPKRTFQSVITIISILGVLLGVAVLVIVLSVMSGFDDMWRDKILSFNAHVTVTGLEIIEEPDALIEEIKKVEGVTGGGPFVQGLVFLQKGDRVYTPAVAGVDPATNAPSASMPEHMVRGTFYGGGRRAAHGARPGPPDGGGGGGSSMLVYSPQKFSEPNEVTLPEEFKVTGIFDVGMWEFDIGFVLTSWRRRASCMAWSRARTASR